MRKIQLFVLSVVVVLFTACHGNLWDAIDDLDARVARLEELCKEMNTNITSLQTIVSVIQENDVITGITPIEKGGKVIGYTITFDKHEPITIYNGEDGKDGANGANGVDGKDGYTPILGVAKDTDGVYYWTLDGEWLLDAEGNKLRVTGRDGKDGVDGEDGKDGADGKDGQDGQDGKDGVDGEDGKDGQDGTNGTNGVDGKDGITPQLKIEEGYWYISYDKGATWAELGKAVGEDGKDGVDGENGQDGKPGADGKDGQDGDSMFTSVTYDENNVYFTLTDGGVLIIPRGNSTSEFDQTLIDNVVTSLILDKEEMNFSYSEIGTTKTIVATTLPFAESKVRWESSNLAVATVEDGVVLAIGSGDAVITAFAGDKKAECLVFVGTTHECVDLGLPSGLKWATCNVGAEKPEEYGDYFAWGEVEPKETYSWSTYKYCVDNWDNITKYCANSASGKDGFVDNKTVLDPEDDVAHVNWGGAWRMPTLAEQQELVDNCTWTWTTQNGVNGCKVTGPNGNSIFLPAADSMFGGTFDGAGSYGGYWSSSIFTSYSDYAYYVYFYSDEVDWGNYRGRYYGLSVRPVCQ